MYYYYYLICTDPPLYPPLVQQLQQEHQKEYKQWNKNLKPRKQRLEDEFKRQVEEQERFYLGNSSNNFLHDFTVMMESSLSHDVQENEFKNAQFANNINTITATSSASDNSNDHFYQ